MADIRNLITEGDTNATGYDYSIMRKGVDESAGNLLSNIGDIVEGTAKTIDKAIQGNIQSDIYKEKDAVDEQMGVNAMASVNESTGLPMSAPPEIDTSFNNLKDYQEAVRQGKLSPEIYELRAQAISKQLRVKYPGYREVIDDKIQSTFGINPANAVRRNILSALDNEANSADAQRKQQLSSLQRYESIIGDSPSLMTAYAQHESGALVDPRIMMQVRTEAMEANALKLKTEQLKVQEQTREEAGRNFGIMLNQVGMGLVKQQLGGLSFQQFVDQRLADGLTEQEKVEISNVLIGLRSRMKEYADTFYNSPVLDESGNATGKVKGHYLPSQAPYNEQIDKFVQNLGSVVFPKDKDYNYAALMDEARVAGAMDNLYQDPNFNAEFLTSKLFKRYEPQGAPDVKNRMVQNWANYQQIQMGRNLVQAVEGARMSDPTLSAETVRDLVTDLSKPVDETGVEFKPEAITVKIGNILNPEQNVLKLFNPANRQEVFKKIMTPEFIKNVEKYGSDQAKQMLKPWLASSFQRIYAQEVGEFAQLANMDATGFQLSYDPKAGFKLAREGNAAGGNLAMLSTLGGLPGAVGTVNSFLQTYRLALGDMPDEQKAEELQNIIEGTFGATTSPNAGGGFWYRAKEAIKGYLSGDKQSDAEGVTVTPTSASPVDDIADALDKYEGAGNYDTLFAHSQNKFGVDVSEMSINEALNFANGAYGEWSKGKLGYKATPMGRYQIVGTTLKTLKDEMGLTGNELFDKSMQDKMFVTLLKRRGLDDYLSGKIDSKQFIRQAKDEWEGLKSKQAQQDFLAAVNRVKESMS